MNYFEKTKKAITESRGKKIFDIKSGKSYLYKENPYFDMMIENCVFCDMFPEEVKNKANFYGFERENYILSEIA